MIAHNIPFDILEIIVALCDRKDLLVLSQVDRTLQDLAEQRATRKSHGSAVAADIMYVLCPCDSILILYG